MSGGTWGGLQRLRVSDLVVVETRHAIRITVWESVLRSDTVYLRTV